MAKVIEECPACGGRGEIETGGREQETGYAQTVKCLNCGGAGEIEQPSATREFKIRTRLTLELEGTFEGEDEGVAIEEAMRETRAMGEVVDWDPTVLGSCDQVG